MQSKHFFTIHWNNTLKKYKIIASWFFSLFCDMIIKRKTDFLSIHETKYWCVEEPWPLANRICILCCLINYRKVNCKKISFLFITLISFVHLSFLPYMYVFLNKNLVRTKIEFHALNLLEISKHRSQLSATYWSKFKITNRQTYSTLTYI